ncbi:hypothetical protein DID99_27660 [Burkholderia sp. Bp8986]|nr:hypothetical protein DID99_27660 [Burkholderia sp. Bp8986]
MERAGPAPTGAAVRLLPSQQSVQCFAPHGKHRFLITKAGLLRRMQRRGNVLPGQRIRRYRARRDARRASQSDGWSARHC